MHIDQDRPSTWLPFRKGLCNNCQATCCTMPLEVCAEDLVRLGVASEDELSAPKKMAKRLIREKIVRTYRQATGLYLLEQKNGRDCLFLGSDRKCTVYDKRPNVCRDFPTKIGPRVGFCPYKKI